MLETFGVIVLLVFAAFALFALTVICLNARLWWLSLRAKEGERVPSMIPFAGGFVGAVLVWFGLKFAAQAKIDVPEPWFWILLPLLLDMGSLGAMVMYLLGARPSSRKGGPN